MEPKTYTLPSQGPQTLCLAFATDRGLKERCCFPWYTHAHQFTVLRLVLLTWSIAEIPAPELSLIGEVIHESFFLVHGQEPIVWQAFLEFQNGSYFASLLTMLPLIEHGLRKIYLFLHDCPGARGIKLDSLLKPKLDNGSPNLLYKDIPAPLRHALFDLFVWREGNVMSARQSAI